MDITALFHLNYGIYLITAGEKKEGAPLAGCLVNTVFQITAEPPTVAVSVSKHNQTCERIHETGHMAVTVMEENTDSKLLGKFGYRTGRDIDKFADTRYHLDESGCPLIEEGAVAYISCEVLKEVDMDTHTIFICSVTDAKTVNTETKPMTYQYYREVKKLQSSKYAPTYVNPTAGK